MELIDLLIENKERNEKYFRKPVFYAGKIKARAKELFGENIRVFLFGSVVKKNYTPTSDIDMLVVAPGIENKIHADKLVYLKQDFEMDAPFSIILCNEKKYEDWFRPFILDKYKEI